MFRNFTLATAVLLFNDGQPCVKSEDGGASKSPIWSSAITSSHWCSPYKSLPIIIRACRSWTFSQVRLAVVHRCASLSQVYVPMAAQQ
jgi:hypothetical protein